MQKSKRLLYVALILLICGIVIRYLTEQQLLAIMLISLGVFAKIAYLIIMLIKNQYKPGFELLVLLIGLSLFFAGFYLPQLAQTMLSNVFIVVGISFKIAFVTLFVRKIKANKNE